ncbi:endolysin [Corynebacterium phage phi673]|uniref:Lysin A n=1 Tax=Corynebacterium phage phi673 TaxID=2052821 RepID=A0A2H4PIV9_9CAUD|nr:endolysin [Corynebacterium phage phi673]ATW62884.1 lysin A [Corynebacterium phage phi673]
MATMPVDKGFYVTSPYAERWGTFHWGTDFGLDGGSGGHPIYAVKYGTVTAAGPASGFGQWINLDHPGTNGGGLSVYGHIIPEVRVGQVVVEGQRIGYINPNSATNGGVAPHLHFEYHRYMWAPPGADRLDPEKTVLAGAHWPGDARSFDVDTLGDLMGWTLTRERYAQLYPSYVKMLDLIGASSINAHAMIGAQLGHESVGLKYQEEIASGSAYEWRADLGNTVAGDGVRFKGHGWIQVTGRGNHLTVSQWAHARGIVPSPTYFVDNPTQLGSDQYCWVGPAWYLTAARSGFMAAADRGELENCTRMINGGLNGIDDRRARYNRALILGERLIPNDGGFLMALSDDEQRELLDKTRRIHHELTHEFQSLYTDKDGNRSTWRGTMMGYLLQLDRKVENVHQFLLPEVLTTIQVLVKKDKTKGDNDNE